MPILSRRDFFEKNMGLLVKGLSRIILALYNTVDYSTVSDTTQFIDAPKILHPNKNVYMGYTGRVPSCYYLTLSALQTNTYTFTNSVGTDGS